MQKVIIKKNAKGSAKAKAATAYIKTLNADKAEVSKALTGFKTQSKECNAEYKSFLAKKAKFDASHKRRKSPRTNSPKLMPQRVRACPNLTLSLLRSKL